MGAVTPGTVTVTDRRPWVPCLIVVWTRATLVLDASLATVTAVLVACPGSSPVSVTVTRTAMCCAASAVTNRYAVPVAPEIGAPLRSHW